MFEVGGLLRFRFEADNVFPQTSNLQPQTYLVSVSQYSKEHKEEVDKIQIQ